MAKINLPEIVQEIRVELDKQGNIQNLKQIDSLIKKLDFLRQEGRITGEQASEALADIRLELARAEEQIEGTSAQFTNLNKVQARATSTLQRATVQTGNFSKAASSANQVLFNTGDAVQDAAQFQFGFAQGARAVGNNLAFGAEQFALLAQTAKREGIALGTALKGAFFGVGGILFAINAAITLITVFGDRIFGAGKEVEKLNENLKTTSDFLSDIANTEIGNIFDDNEESIDRSISKIDTALSKIQENLIDIKFDDFIATPLQSSASDATNVADQFNIVDGILPSINNELTKSDIKEREALEAVREVLLNKRAKLRAQQLINEALDNTIERQELIRQKGIELTEQARESIEPPAVPEDIILGLEDIDVGIDVAPPPVGSIANDLGVLKDLRDEFDRATTESERQSVLESIRLKEQELEAKKAILKEEEDATKISYNQIAQAASFAIRGLFGESKAGAIATAIIDGSVAFNKALASAPPPFNYALAGAVAASALAQINKIKSTEFGDTSSGGASGASSVPRVASGGGFIRRSGSERLPTFGQTIPRQQAISFNPRFDVSLDRRGLRVLSRQGEGQIKRSQVGLSS